MNIVDAILKNKYGRFKAPLIKIILKIIPSEVNITWIDNDKDDGVQESSDLTSEMDAIIKRYKAKDYSKNETIEELRKQLSMYNIEMKALPTLVYEVWDKE